MYVIFLCVELMFHAVRARNHIYYPEWEDLDKHPLPQWYDVAKIGIFVHWGLYAVPAVKSEWFWYFWDQDDPEVLDYIKKHNITNYEEFVPSLTGESLDTDEWAELFVKAGAQYVVFTTKHHDGYAFFKNSGAPFWNSVQSGPKKDVVDLVSKSVRKYSMKFGVYYSLLEWHNKYFSTSESLLTNKVKYVENVVVPDIQKLIMKYQPSVLWTDGDWEEYSDTWRAKEILAWIYNESPVKDEIVVNDRWGMNARYKHGDFYNGVDRLNPRKLLHHKWENALTLDKESWGFRSDMKEIMSIGELLENIVVTVSCGGNVLINVGPTKEGIIIPKFQRRLWQLGTWLEVNGEAIYDTSPWYHQNDSLNSDVWYTCKKAAYNPWRTSHVPDKNETVVAIYAIFLKWPDDDQLRVRDLTGYMKKGQRSIYLLEPGNNTANGIELIVYKDLAGAPYKDETSSLTSNLSTTFCFQYAISSDVVTISLPRSSAGAFFRAWTLKIT